MKMKQQAKGGREDQDKLQENFAFAEGKRDDMFSPAATSGHVLKLTPTIVLQRVSEEEAREGEGAFSHMLGCLV